MIWSVAASVAYPNDLGPPARPNYGIYIGISS